MSTPPAIAPDAERLRRRLDAMARIGASAGGGVTRLALTEEDGRARDLLARWLQEIGLDVRMDAVGNLFGIRAGREDAPAVLVGSHLDTVVDGGRLDGSLGVLAALEAAHTLEERGIATRRPLAIVSFTNEEGVRFRPDMMGSLAFAGHLSVEQMRGAAAADDGATAGECLQRIGYAGERAPGDLPVHAFLELHIEQGHLLERAGATIGVVEGVQGLSWTEIRLRGEANHAGTTPLDARHDAGLVAAEIVAFARALSREIGPGLRATAGSLRLAPGAVNIIPGEATLTVDLRHPEEASLAAAEEALERFAAERAACEGVAIAMQRLARTSPVRFDPGLVALVEATAHRLGHTTLRLTSGAGHDAQILAARHPAAMIFIPSRGGRSHCPEEETAPADIAAGAEVLLHVVLQLAEAV